MLNWDLAAGSGCWGPQRGLPLEREVWKPDGSAFKRMGGEEFDLGSIDNSF